MISCIKYSIYFVFKNQVERKRARNRVAATKCRLRKLERISVLDTEASKLRAENDSLNRSMEKLRLEVNI